MDTLLKITNCIALGIGYTAMLAAICFGARPLLRGLSYGLYQTTLLIKLGAPAKVWGRALRDGVFKEPVKWLFKNNVTSESNSFSSWSGIFQWSFSKEVNRGLWKRWEDEKPAREAARQKALDDDV